MASQSRENSLTDPPPRFQSVGGEDITIMSNRPPRTATTAATSDLKSDYSLSSPASSTTKKNIQHVDHIEPPAGHEHHTGTTGHRDPYHFDRADDPTVFKALQLQQGALNDPEPIEVEGNWLTALKDEWWWREGWSEFWGTFVLILVGDGAVAQVSLNNGTKGNFLSIAFAWAVAVPLGVYVASPSGGHLNAAVTFMQCALRKLPWRKLPVYAAFQIMGAYVAAAVVYGLYKPQFDAFDGGNRSVMGPTATAGIFCTYPNATIAYNTGYQFFSEFVCSFLLGFVLLAFGDPSGLAPGIATPLALFMLLFAEGTSLGVMTGWSMSLPRDLGPRLFSAAIYGREVFTAYDYYFLIPPLQSFFGVTAGGVIYDAFIFRGDSPINRPFLGLYKPKSKAAPRSPAKLNSCEKLV